MVKEPEAVISFFRNIQVLKETGDIRRIFERKNVEELRRRVCEESIAARNTFCWEFLDERDERNVLDIGAEDLNEDSLIEMVFFVYCLGDNDVSIFSNVEKVAALLESDEYTKHIAEKMRIGYDISALTLNELLGL